MRALLNCLSRVNWPGRLCDDCNTDMAAGRLSISMFHLSTDRLKRFRPERHALTRPLTVPPRHAQRAPKAERWRWSVRRAHLNGQHIAHIRQLWRGKPVIKGLISRATCSGRNRPARMW